MGPRDRFVEAVHRPDDEIPLDLVWALVTTHAHPAVDADTLVARLDDLAAAVRTPTLDGVLAHVFADQGFTGNDADYYDPANSYLDDVLDRHLGIPITLSVLTMEVARRHGVPLDGVGLPGHFLLRDRVDPTVFVDAFRGGTVLDGDAVAALYRGLHGAEARFDPAWLAPTRRAAICFRLLANLVAIHERRRDAAALVWTRDLQAEVAAAVGDQRSTRRLRAGFN